MASRNKVAQYNNFDRSRLCVSAESNNESASTVPTLEYRGRRNQGPFCIKPRANKDSHLEAASRTE